MNVTSAQPISSRTAVMRDAQLILASKSKARLAMLTAAGVAVEAISPNVDEDALKDGLKSEGVTARNLADALAEAKAVRLSGRIGAGMVLGADQVLALEDGTMLDKPADPADAVAQLKLLSGKKHKLFSAAVIAEQGVPVWRHIDIATLSVRMLGDQFIEQYVEAEWDNIRYCVGCYEIEGRGAQLFSAINGSQFTIMGLPLLHLLDYLRIRGILPS
jgi:septum formation protein